MSYDWVWNDSYALRELNPSFLSYPQMMPKKQLYHFLWR